MDTKDVLKEPIIWPYNLFSDIWEKQEELMFFYKEIEKWPVVWPVNLDLKDSQLLIKDMIARIVEELAEAHESFLLQQGDNFFEELADAHHFFMETLILSESLPFFQDYWKDMDIISSTSLNPNPLVAYSSVQGWFWQITFELNLARNSLRNKPWKQTQVQCNFPVYYEHLTLAYQTFIRGYMAYTLLEIVPKPKAHKVIQEPVSVIPPSWVIYSDYVFKNRINQFRIKSKY